MPHKVYIPRIARALWACRSFLLCTKFEKPVGCCSTVQIVSREVSNKLQELLVQHLNRMQLSTWRCLRTSKAALVSVMELVELTCWTHFTYQTRDAELDRLCSHMLLPHFQIEIPFHWFFAHELKDNVYAQSFWFHLTKGKQQIPKVQHCNVEACILTCMQAHLQINCGKTQYVFSMTFRTRPLRLEGQQGYRNHH